MEVNNRILNVYQRHAQNMYNDKKKRIKLSSNDTKV